ncbi:hypothetical protein K227x_63660 [Rubripirellula lacrimiformis]|uniref:Uncharacterized protein n=1 Tax=Rubripirellula lacrimiformis TaxID=1930273 RepID=A0A517NLC0_9BACT|nr:hypothetical protein [Rubripirellula lacrimiformis]QDT07937.1 hypothetical protein K227x_63660 [Rubripirellula lacrimiformis]
MSQSINRSLPRSTSAVRRTLAGLAAALVMTMMAPTVSAQSAGSWVDIGNGFAGAGGSASGPISIVKGRSSSKNGMQFGHGFALGAGPNGLAISNSVGAGAGPGGVAHNMNLNIGANGTHFSQGGVVSQGGNRRVISGGQTGTRNGQVYGGSQSTGFGQNTKAWSQSHTRQWGQPTYQPAVQPGYQSGMTNQRWFGNRR